MCSDVNRSIRPLAIIRIMVFVGLSIGIGLGNTSLILSAEAPAADVTIDALLHEVEALSGLMKTRHEELALLEEIAVVRAQMGDEIAAQSAYQKFSNLLDHQVKAKDSEKGEHARDKIRLLGRMACAFDKKGQAELIARTKVLISKELGFVSEGSMRLFALKELLPCYVKMDDQVSVYRYAESIVESDLRVPAEVNIEVAVLDFWHYLINLELSAKHTEAAKMFLSKALARLESSEFDDVRMHMLPKFAALEVLVGSSEAGEAHFRRGMSLRERFVTDLTSDGEGSRLARRFAFYRVRELSTLASSYVGVSNSSLGRTYLKDALGALERVHPDDEGLAWGQILRAAAILREDAVLRQGIAFAQQRTFSDELLQELLTILVQEKRLDLARQIAKDSESQVILAEVLENAREDTMASVVIERLDLDQQLNSVIRSASRVRTRTKGVTAALQWSETRSGVHTKAYIILGVIDELIMDGGVRYRLENQVEPW